MEGGERYVSFNSLSRDHINVPQQFFHFCVALISFQLPLSGSLIIIISIQPSLSQKLSTPSLGITIYQQPSTSADIPAIFQLPLSGSLNIAAFNAAAKADIPFNSLSRDHFRNRIRFRLSVASASSLSTPSLGITGVRKWRRSLVRS